MIKCSIVPDVVNPPKFYLFRLRTKTSDSKVTGPISPPKRPSPLHPWIFATAGATVEGAADDEEDDVTAEGMRAKEEGAGMDGRNGWTRTSNSKARM